MHRLNRVLPFKVQEKFLSLSISFFTSWIHSLSWSDLSNYIYYTYNIMRKRLVIPFGIKMYDFWFDSLCVTWNLQYLIVFLFPFIKSRSYLWQHIFSPFVIYKQCSHCNFFFLSKWHFLTFSNTIFFCFFRTLFKSSRSSWSNIFVREEIKFNLTDCWWCQQPNSVINNERFNVLFDCSV